MQNTNEKGFLKRYRNKLFWSGISLKETRKQLRLIDVQIRQEQEKLRDLSAREEALRLTALGTSRIEKSGIAKEIMMLQREVKAAQVILTDLYNQKTTVKQVELYKTMSEKAKRKGLLQHFVRHRDRIMDLIADRSVDITDEMSLWQTLASETDLVFSCLAQYDSEERAIIAELEEAELDRDLEELADAGDPELHSSSTEASIGHRLSPSAGEVDGE